jgi:hypothetical protein
MYRVAQKMYILFTLYFTCQSVYKFFGVTVYKNIDAPKLTCVWQEFEYRIDVCRVTRGVHIERL